MPGLPFSFLNIAHPFQQAPPGSHHQGKRKIGSRIGENIGRISHRNSSGGSGLHINIIEAHRMITDHLQLRAGGIHYFPINMIGQQAQQAIHSTHVFQQLLARRRQLIGPDVGITKFFHQVQPLFRDHARYKNLWLAHLTLRF